MAQACCNGDIHHCQVRGGEQQQQQQQQKTRRNSREEKKSSRTQEDGSSPEMYGASTLARWHGGWSLMRRTAAAEKEEDGSSPEMYAVSTLARWRGWWPRCGPHLCCPLLGSCACLHAGTSSPAASAFEGQPSSGLKVNHPADTCGSGIYW